MPSFKSGVENQIEAILRDYVGVGGTYSDTNGIYVVNKWDRKINDFSIDPADKNLPMVAIIGHTTTQAPRHEMGTSRELFTWDVGVYYLDVDTVDFAAGYDRQDVITNNMKNALENEPRLRELRVQVNPTSPTGAFFEYVWDSDWGTIKWDSSGQEGDYYAYTAEMHLIVKTARN